MVALLGLLVISQQQLLVVKWFILQYVLTIISITFLSINRTLRNSIVSSLKLNKYGKEFINEFSRIAVHWRGNAFFTNQIKNRAQNLKKTIQSDLKKIQ